MKPRLLLLLLPILLCVACKRRSNATPVVQVATDTVTYPKTGELVKRDPDVMNYDEIEQLDSLLFLKALETALPVARQHLNADTFTTQLVTDTISGIEAKVDVQIGHLFSAKQKHVLLRVHGNANIHFALYVVTQGQLKQVAHESLWHMVYVNDTLQDVTGDGYSELLLNWYGSTGCCLKGFTRVLPYLPANGTFAEACEFINPTFSPTEKVIRGICYGHPGHTSVYKYKWNNNLVDTVEYIRYETGWMERYTGKIIRSKEQGENDPSKFTYITAVPKEYKTINEYDWFGDGRPVPGTDSLAVF